MIVPESVKREWKSQPTTVELLKADLQTTRTELEEALQTELEIIKLKLLNTEARLKMDEQTDFLQIVSQFVTSSLSLSKSPIPSGEATRI